MKCIVERRSSESQFRIVSDDPPYHYAVFFRNDRPVVDVAEEIADAVNAMVEREAKGTP